MLRLYELPLDGGSNHFRLGSDYFLRHDVQEPAAPSRCFDASHFAWWLLVFQFGYRFEARLRCNDSVLKAFNGATSNTRLIEVAETRVI